MSTAENSARRGRGRAAQRARWQANHHHRCSRRRSAVGTSSFIGTICHLELCANVPMAADAHRHSAPQVRRGQLGLAAHVARRHQVGRYPGVGGGAHVGDEPGPLLDGGAAAHGARDDCGDTYVRNQRPRGRRGRHTDVLVVQEPSSPRASAGRCAGRVPARRAIGCAGRGQATHARQVPHAASIRGGARGRMVRARLRARRG